MANPFADPAGYDSLHDNPFSDLHQISEPQYAPSAALRTNAYQASEDTFVSGPPSHNKQQHFAQPPREPEPIKQQHSESRIPITEPQPSKDLLKPEKLQPNWPRCTPFLVHAIDKEVPIPQRPLAHKLYSSWFVSIAALALNLVSCFALLVTNATDAATSFGSAIVNCFFIVPLSFFCWYFPVYRALSRESALNYYFFFACNGFHILYMIYMSLGIVKTGSGGLILGIERFSASQTVASLATGTICMITAAFWIASAIFSIVLFKRVYSHYKLKGHKFQDARNEAVSSVVSNPQVQRAAADAAVSAAQNPEVQRAAAQAVFSGVRGGR